MCAIRAVIIMHEARCEQLTACVVRLTKRADALGKSRRQLGAALGGREGVLRLPQSEQNEREVAEVDVVAGGLPQRLSRGVARRGEGVWKSFELQVR